MQAITTVGLDIAKSVFKVHGVDAHGAVIVRRQLRRARLLPFFQKLPACRLREIARKQESGRYFGEMDMSFEYNDVCGEPFTVLQVDPATLSAQAGAYKWTCDILRQTGGHYLARLIAH